MALIFLSGCATSERNIASYEDKVATQVTEYDVFNLKWGYSSEYVKTHCNMGEGATPIDLSQVFHASMYIGEAKMFVNFDFNDEDQLYKVTLMHLYQPDETQKAIDSFVYIHSLLSQKYPKKDKDMQPYISVNPLRYKTERAYEIARLEKNSQFHSWGPQKQIQAWEDGYASYGNRFLTSSTKIDIDLVPDNRFSPGEVRAILGLTYCSLNMAGRGKPTPYQQKVKEQKTRDQSLL